MDQIVHHIGQRANTNFVLQGNGYTSADATIRRSVNIPSEQIATSVENSAQASCMKCQARYLCTVEHMWPGGDSYKEEKNKWEAQRFYREIKHCK